MPRVREKVPRPKYIAEGFHEDASEVLNDFVNMNSVEFSDFVKVWKKKHFSLIFMGRPDHVENTEFTNEIFKVTVHFMASPSFYQKVGAVFLLYALFRNQISDPPVKIRLEISQWRIIKKLHIEAALQKFKTLHYVIDYLIKNAFIYVARQMLRGPVTGVQEVSKNSETVCNLKATYKSDVMEFSVSNNLQKIRDLHIQYYEEKKILGNDKLHMDASSETYEEFINELKDIVQPSTSKTTKGSLGERRAHIKALSYIRKAHHRYENEVDDPQEHKDTLKSKDVKGPIFMKRKKKAERGGRLPPHERRVGRPSSKPKKQEPETEPEDDDDYIDITHLLSQQQEFFLPPVEEEDNYKKLRTRRDPYYKTSPKREEDSSDPDNPV